jgi:hypothetical protein
MKHLMKKVVVGLVATASVASIAYANTSTPAKPEFVEIDVTVTKDPSVRHSSSGSWFRRTVKTEVDAYATPTLKVSMRTAIDKPSIASERRTIKFRSATGRSNAEDLNFNQFSETSVGVDAAYIPAASAASDKSELEYAHVLVNVDDLISLDKFHLSDAKDATIDLPSIKSVRIAVPVVPGDINTVKRGDYTVTVTERTLSN